MPGAYVNMRCGLTSMRIPIIKMRRCRDNPILITGIPIAGKMVFILRLALFKQYVMPLYVEQTKQFIHMGVIVVKSVNGMQNMSSYLMITNYPFDYCLIVDNSLVDSQSSDLPRGMTIGIRYHYGIGAQSKIYSLCNCDPQEQHHSPLAQYIEDAYCPAYARF